MYSKILFILFLIPVLSFGQQNLLPISSFYKDQLFSKIDLSSEKSILYTGPSFLPIHESSFNLHTYIRDSSIQYYDFFEHLFKKHLIEIKGEGYDIHISPTLNLGLGKDFLDTSNRRLFNNTRGFLVEGDILKNFSFSTALYENQNRFTGYETNYYSSVGERYPQADSSYLVQNAIIPGAARTKPFKEGAFDYAYAIGNIVYRPIQQLIFTAGNNAQFVGMGYRSLLLSDNSVPAIYFRADAQLFQKLKFTFLRSKQFNLLRRPNYTTVEAYYESKLYAAHYLDYRVNDRLSVGLFEGSYWKVGDSVSSQAVRGAYYIPAPILGAAITNDPQQVSSLLGLNVGYLFYKGIRVYAQLALSDWKTTSIGSQIGVRYYNVLGLPHSMLQVEYNHVPDKLYVSENTRLHYSSYNLPSAHPKGNGFDELVMRFTYTHKRFYTDIKSILYVLKDHQTGNLIASNFNLPSVSGEIYNQQIELGYRINRRMNLEVFAQHRFRSSSLTGEINTSAFLFGLRTGLLNHYDDF